ncbi:Lrp/AsnC family transcriptional regulator [Actinomadura kijaniata]|uniref:Lrp/AsnC family transcriptional regulator n=1 Tax=Actinomadura kijaniata TaxID=46161 RepID=UPI00082F77D0|nr:Lrp/AsnC family transcriptional regulator [Actinomadura kijaniata]
MAFGDLGSASAAGTDLDRLAEYVLNRVGTAEGVLSTRTHLAHRLHREASRWRLDSLSQDQRRGLERPGDGDRESGRLRPDGIALALAPDGRRSHTTLAARTGMSETRVRRLLTQMLGSGRIVLRCEVEHRLAGWRVTGALWLAVPPPRLEPVADSVATMRETRLVCSVAGEANLVANVWVHSLAEMAEFETRVVARYPEVRVVDRSVTLQWVKRVGRLLDADGRSVAYVPMDLWDPPNP